MTKRSTAEATATAIGSDKLIFLTDSQGVTDVDGAFVIVSDVPGAEVVAEGVEKIEQWDWLVQEGCHQVQGYYFSKPLPPDAAYQFMTAFAKNQLVV